MDKIQIEMLKQMLQWDGGLGYDWFDKITVDGKEATKKDLQKNMKELREKGLVAMGRGGLNDDGEIVGGTYFYIPYGLLKVVDKIVEDHA